MMTIRSAKVSDAAAICMLINYHAERGKMLHRSLEGVYDALREFLVAEDGEEIVGCVAVDIFWADLAEIKSLAVAPGRLRQGVGLRLVRAEPFGTVISPEPPQVGSSPATDGWVDILAASGPLRPELTLALAGAA